MLTEDQEIAFQSIQSNQLVYISGPAGTGKSFLIQYIQEDCRKKNIPVVTLSSTGISAHHINGSTVHSFICRLRLKMIEPAVSTVFIIDEISMLGKKVFSAFEAALRKYYCTSEYFDPKDRSHPFGGAKVIFFGDFAQLPPINDEFCFFDDSWEAIQAKHELTTVKRQRETEFKDFLARVRTGKLQQMDKDRIQSMTKHCPRQGDIRLFLSNAEAEEYNAINLRELMNQTDVQATFFPSHKESSGFDMDECKSFFQDRHQCYETLSICVGAKVMLTANLDIANGWCNGTLGFVVDIRGDMILMKNTKGECLPISRKEYTRNKYRMECQVVVSEKGKKKVCGQTDCLHSPTYSFVDDDTMNVENKDAKDAKDSLMKLKVLQFPLLLAWGITIHKSQGMSLESCVITLPYQYSPSLLYVAFSRCISFERLCIRTEHPIKYDQIRPSEEVMEHIFHWKHKTCKLCKEEYMGSYASFCADCSSAPGKYSMYRFIDFIPEANPSPDMIQYMNYVLQNQSKGTTSKWKKFVAFCKSI